jgi:hypothetical protein
MPDTTPDEECAHYWADVLECVHNPGGGMTVVWYCHHCKQRWVEHDEP